MAAPLQAQSLCQHQELGFMVFQAACCSALTGTIVTITASMSPYFCLTHTRGSPPDRVLNQLSAGLLAAVEPRCPEAGCQGQLTTHPIPTKDSKSWPLLCAHLNPQILNHPG